MTGSLFKRWCSDPDVVIHAGDDYQNRKDLQPSFHYVIVSCWQTECQFVEMGYIILSPFRNKSYLPWIVAKISCMVVPGYFHHAKKGFWLGKQ
jgi:hypothetical protein